MEGGSKPSHFEVGNGSSSVPRNRPILESSSTRRTTWWLASSAVLVSCIVSALKHANESQLHKANLSVVLLLVHPVMYLLGIWGMVAGPVWMRAALLHLCPRVVTRNKQPSTEKLRPLKVPTAWAAYRLGCLHERVAQLGFDAKAAATELAEAGSICGAPSPLTLAELQEVGRMLKVMADHKGAFARARGLLTTVNILWMISIVGLSLTLFPAISGVLSLFMEPFYHMIFELCQQLMVVVETAIHWLWTVSGPFHELMIYYVSFVIIADATRSPSETGTHIALTGTVIGTMAWVHSSALHLNATGGSAETYMMVAYLFHVFMLAPMAVKLQSSLLGWLAVATICGVLGFSVACGGLVTFIGFHSEDALARCLAVTCVANIGYLGMMAADRLPSWLQPFRTGVHTFAGPVYFLSLLIASSYYGPYRKYYCAMQLVMSAALLLQIIVGGIYNLPATRNVAVVYTVLYLMEKSTEATWLWGEFVWLTLFVISLCTWRISLFLKMNPNYLLPLLSADAFKAKEGVRVEA